jgi:sarcosine oxidase subunit alpha
MLLSLAARASKYISGLAAVCFPKRGVRIEGLPLMLRQSALSIGGLKRVAAVKTAALSANGNLLNGSEKLLETDVVITACGLSPLVELAQVAGCALHHLPEMGGWVPVHSDRFETLQPGLFIAGSISGVEGAALAEIQGCIAGLAAAEHLKLSDSWNLNEQIYRHQENIAETRRSTIPFYPQIEAGRARMNRIWSQSVS